MSYSKHASSVSNCSYLGLMNEREYLGASPLSHPRKGTRKTLLWRRGSFASAAATTTPAPSEPSVRSNPMPGYRPLRIHNYRKVEPRLRKTSRGLNDSTYIAVIEGSCVDTHEYLPRCQLWDGSVLDDCMVQDRFVIRRSSLFQNQRFSGFRYLMKSALAL